MNFSETIILFFSFQAILLSIVFFVTKKMDKVANRIFALFLLLFGYNLFYNVLYWSRFDPTWFAALSYTYQIPLSLYGGVFYLYVRTITTKQRFSWKDAIHAIPFLFVLVRFGSFYILPLQTKIDVLTNRTAYKHIISIAWSYPIIIAILFGYAIFTYVRFIRKYKNDPDFSIWLKTISFAFILFALSHVIYCTMVNLSLIRIEYDYFITFFMILFIAMVCYFAFIHTAISNGVPIKKIIPLVKYEKTGLSKDFSLELKGNLLNLMAEQKPYLDPNLRLDSLAELMNISRHHASQIINEHFSVSFFDFINTYRIKEAERLLLSSEHQLSVKEIAYTSGFNNRISFYNSFKKLKGLTPLQYRDHNMAS